MTLEIKTIEKEHVLPKKHSMTSHDNDFRMPFAKDGEEYFIYARGAADRYEARVLAEVLSENHPDGTFRFGIGIVADMEPVTSIDERSSAVWMKTDDYLSQLLRERENI